MNNCKPVKMNKKLIVFIFMLAFFVFWPAMDCEGQIFRPDYSSRPDKAIFGKSLKRKKQATVKEPRAVTRARKKQEENEKRQDREYEEFVRNNRNRSLEIQEPQVRDRMIANRAESDYRYKVKKKKISERNRKTGRKYR